MFRARRSRRTRSVEMPRRVAISLSGSAPSSSKPFASHWNFWGCSLPDNRPKAGMPASRRRRRMVSSLVPMRAAKAASGIVPNWARWSSVNGSGTLLLCPCISSRKRGCCPVANRSNVQRSAPICRSPVLYRSQARPEGLPTSWPISRSLRLANSCASRTWAAVGSGSTSPTTPPFSARFPRGGSWPISFSPAYTV